MSSSRYYDVRSLLFFDRSLSSLFPLFTTLSNAFAIRVSNSTIPPFSAIAVIKASGLALKSCKANAKTIGKSDPVNAEIPMAIKPIKSHHFLFFASTSFFASSAS